MTGSEFDLFSLLAAASHDGSAMPEFVCSRAGCAHAATYRIEWRNPRIHGPERVKIWLACEEHLEFLSGFLRARRFPTRIHAVTDPLDERPLGDGERRT